MTANQLGRKWLYWGKSALERPLSKANISSYIDGSEFTFVGLGGNIVFLRSLPALDG